MYIDVEAKDNTNKSFSMLYRDVSASREVYCVKYELNGEDSPVRVKGWDNETNSPCPAYACHVEESGDGTALLIYGGSGGIRMKPLEDETEWKIGVITQKGETHLVYPLNCFIIYKDQI